VTDERFAGWVLLAIAIVTALAFQGTRGLYETTEGRYAEVAREMLRSGDYLTPTLDNEPHWTKPPLTYWSIAAGIRVFGLNAWGARFFNVIAFSITVLAVAGCGAALWGRTSGYISGLVYASYVAPALGASVVTTDTLLAMWETLAAFCYLRAYRMSPQPGQEKWIRLMWLAFGLAFFTKGPPGLLPLLAIAVFHQFARRPFRFADPIGVTAFLAASMWWFVWSAARDPSLAAYFLGQEVVARSFSSEFKRNAQWWGAFVIYVPWLVVGQGLWIYDGIRMVKNEALYAPRRWIKLLGAGGSAGLFVFLWFVIPTIVFFASKSRLQLYVLPLFAPLALAVGRFSLRAAGEGSALRRAMRIAVISAALIVVGKGVAAHWPSSSDSKSLFEAALRAGGKDATYVLYREKGLYGFEFYADREVARVSSSKKDEWADMDLEAFVADVASAPPGHRYVVVSSPQFAPQLRGAFSGSGIQFTETGHRRWTLFAVRGRAP
jgi:4-amino-4-deoxy-L-arabinose transferase-like glycosyltransferase